MATAKDIVDGDRIGLSWLQALDTDGGRPKYHQTGPAMDGAEVHIYQHDDGRLEIMLDAAGRTLLRQDGPGLPLTMNVRLAIRHSPGPGFPIVGGWGGGVFKYVQRGERRGQGRKGMRN